jgi:hypothetical protein
MAKYAVVQNGVVATVAQADSALESNWVLLPANSLVCVGYTYANGVFTAPPAPPAPVAAVKSWPPFVFYRKFTQAERIAAHTLGLTDNIARDFLHLLDNAVASGTAIFVDDPDVIAGLDRLSNFPAGTPVLVAGRSTQILT